MLSWHKRLVKGAVLQLRGLAMHIVVLFECAGDAGGGVSTALGGLPLTAKALTEGAGMQWMGKMSAGLFQRLAITIWLLGCNCYDAWASISVIHCAAVSKGTSVGTCCLLLQQSKRRCDVLLLVSTGQCASHAYGG
jgi:hypothetical protein